MSVCVQGPTAGACYHGWYATTTNTCIRYFGASSDYTTAKAACRQIDGDLVTLENIMKVFVFKGYLQHIGEDILRGCVVKQRPDTDIQVNPA